MCLQIPDLPWKVHKDSADFIAVCHQLEFHAQHFRCTFAHEHTLHKNFKIIHNGTDFFIQFDIELDDFFIHMDKKGGGDGGVIDSVVLIKIFPYGIPHSVAAHISLVSQDDSSGYWVNSAAGTLIMLPYGTYNDSNILGRKFIFLEDIHSHKRAAVGMVAAVNAVADVVEQLSLIHI